MKQLLGFVGIFLLWASIASTAYANVLINEIAWMGTAISSSDEWIELYNTDPTPVDLSGWRLDADDGSPAILLSGTIAGSGYFLLERTNDSTVPDITADMIYVGALSNGGETLRLKDFSGNEMHTVVGGADWGNVGGSSVTFETAQRTGNSWITGAPTPRAQNGAQAGEVAGESTEEVTASEEIKSVVVVGSSSGSSVKSIYPRANIVVDAGEDKRGFVGFPLAFSGSSTGLYNEPLPYATYRWNFGDGAVSGKQSVEHVYDFVGEYTVTLEVFWASYHRTDRILVNITNPNVIISRVISGEKGYIELTNRTDREMDISGWYVDATGMKPFVFSPNSIIPPGKTFTLANRISGFVSYHPLLALHYPSGVEAFSWLAQTPTPSIAVNSVVVKAPVVRKNVTGASSAQNTNLNSTEKPEPIVLGASLVYAPDVTGGNPMLATSSEVANVLWSGQALPIGSDENETKWIFVFIMTALVFVAGFLLVRSHIDEPTAAEEYSIIEDIIEGSTDLTDERSR